MDWTRNRRTLLSLDRISDARPGERRLDAVHDELETLRWREWSDGDFAGRPDAELVRLAKAAKLLVQQERAARACSLYLHATQDFKLYPSQRDDHRKALRVQRLIQQELDRRIAAHQAAVRLLRSA